MRSWFNRFSDKIVRRKEPHSDVEPVNINSKNRFKPIIEGENSKYLQGMQFCATLQLRTPLRILKRHGFIISLNEELPDDFEPWMGIWLPKTKPLGDFGLKRTDGKKSDFELTAASDIGYVKPKEYLPFLIAIREIIENNNIEHLKKKDLIQEICHYPCFKDFEVRHGGYEKIFSYFHPEILDLIKGITELSKNELNEKNLNTVENLNAESDASLLKIKGLGNEKLKIIRKFCEQFDGDIKSRYSSLAKNL